MLSKSWQVYPKSPLKLCYLFIRSWDSNSQLSLSRHKLTSAIRLSADADVKCTDTQRIYTGIFHLSWVRGGSVLLFRTLRIMTDRTYTAAVLWHESILKQRSQYLQIINFIHKE